MKNMKTIIRIGILALLALAAGGVAAQNGTGPQEANAPSANVASAISYQGRLVDPNSGEPLSGNFDLEFTFWDDQNAGGQVGPANVRNGESIEDGLYRTELNVESELIRGQELWLQIRVKEAGAGTWEKLTPRVQVLPTVYALSLRPGARVRGSIGRPDAIIMATNTSHGFGLRGESRDAGGYGILGYLGSSSTFAYGAGIKGSVLATGYGVVGSSDSGHGVGVAGYTQDGYGVFGVDVGDEDARGYGGYFESENGVGVFGRSWASSTGNNLFAPGVYGRSQEGTGVYGRSNGVDAEVSAGVLGWGWNGPGGRFLGSGVNLIMAEEYIPSGTGVILTRFRVQKDGEVYADGGYHCGRNSSCLLYSEPADFAEVLPAVGDPEPGDVLAVDADGTLVPSTKAYQTSVVGVYSTNPTVLGNADQLNQEGQVPLALVGLVPVKASAENGPIVPGDLLVASATLGHCMAAGANPPQGTVVGKAMEGLAEGTGVIQMLVTLQ